MTVQPTYEIDAPVMNKEVKALWLEALRNPEAKQTKRYLKTEYGNCCLGIACDLATERGIVSVSEKVAGFLFFYSYVDSDGVRHTADAILPNSVSQWMGMPSNSPYFTIMWKDSHKDVYLTSLNDKDGMTFEQIAQVIEYVF